MVLYEIKETLGYQEHSDDHFSFCYGLELIPHITKIIFPNFLR